MINFEHATREQINTMIEAPVTADHIKTILKVVRDYGIGYVTLFQHGEKLDATTLNSQIPMIIVAGDDTSQSCGPSAFDPLTLRICTMRAACIAIISSEVVPNIYTMLSLMTGLLRANTLIIETRPEHEQSWVEYVRGQSPDIPVILSTAMPFELGRSQV